MWENPTPLKTVARGERLMPPNSIEEECCPKCSTMLDLIARTKDGEDMTERYYCGRCSQEYSYQYEFKDIIKE